MIRDTEDKDPIPCEDALEERITPEGMVEHRFSAFNTDVSLSAYAPAPLARTAFDEARSLCRVYERLFSATLSRSDVSRINGARGKATPVDPRTADVVGAALRYCEETEGLFDITMGTITRLWDFHRGVVPSDGAIAEGLRHVGWRGVRVFDRDGSSYVQLSDPSMRIDLGGIAKGWIADAIGDALYEAGLKSFIVNLGGNVLAIGARPDGSPWRIGVRSPFEHGAVIGSVGIQNASAVTSGISERGFERDGAWFHHILDPATGRPAESDLAAITVVAARSIDAEGYSTALLAMGLERAEAFAKGHPAIIAAYAVTSDGRLREIAR